MIILIACAILSVADSDTVHCQVELLRILGDGSLFGSGVNAPELQHRPCLLELMLDHLAKDQLEKPIEVH